MGRLHQKLVPGIVGISTYVDCIYHKELQSAALAASGDKGPINRLRTVTVTIDFKELIDNLRAGDIGAAEDQVAAATKALEAGGADFILVTSGTTSTLTDGARREVKVPFLDLADAAVAEAVAADADSVGVLSSRRAAAGGIFQAAAGRQTANVLVPPPDVAERIDAVIFDELVFGVVAERSLAALRDAMAALVQQGATSIILGNTDMALAADTLSAKAGVPVIDSARAHARAAARAALGGIASIAK